MGDTAARAPASFALTFSRGTARAVHTAAPDCAATYAVQALSDGAAPSSVPVLSQGGGRPFHLFFAAAPLGCWADSALFPGAPGPTYGDVATSVIGASDAAGNTAFIQTSKSALTYNGAFVSHAAPSASADPVNGLPAFLNGTTSRVITTWLYGSMSTAQASVALDSFGPMWNGGTFPLPLAIAYSNLRVDAATWGADAKVFLEAQAAGCPYYFTATEPPDVDACAQQGVPPFELTATSFGAIPGTELAAAVLIAGAGGLNAAAYFWCGGTGGHAALIS